jgi:hypothetical protein
MHTSVYQAVHDRLQPPTTGRGHRKAFLISCVDRDDRDLPTYGEVEAAYGGIARAVEQY